MNKLDQPTTPNEVKKQLVGLEKKKLYAFTINPSQQHETCKAVERLEKMRKMLTNLVSDMQLSNIEYYFIVEASDMMTNAKGQTCSRIHLHGYLWIPDNEALVWFLLEYVTTLCKTSMYEIKELFTDFEDWWKYCHWQNILGDPITNIWGDPKETLMQMFSGKYQNDELKANKSNMSRMLIPCTEVKTKHKKKVKTITIVESREFTK